MAGGGFHPAGKYSTMRSTKKKKKLKKRATAAKGLMLDSEQVQGEDIK